MRVYQIVAEELINVKLNQSTFDIPLNCIFDIDYRSTQLYGTIVVRRTSI